MLPKTNTAQGPAREEQPRKRLDLRAYAMFGALLVIWTFFTFTTDGAFLTPRNLSNLAVQMSVTGILATGMVLVIVAGHVDLSVGSLVGLLGGVAAILEVWLKWPTPLALGATLVLGALLGTLNGWIVAYQKVPAFIVTLGGLMAWRGVLLGITKGITVAGFSKPFKALGQGFVPESAGLVLAAVATGAVMYMLMRSRAARQRYGLEVGSTSSMLVQGLLISGAIWAFVLTMNAYRGIPIPIFVVLTLAGLYTFIANRTRLGRHIYAIGGNLEAARFSGIPVQKLTLTVFIMNGILAAIAGLVLTGRLNAATITAGQSYELDAVAACVIGGTSLMGGVGKVPTAVVGALIMASLDNGMSMMNTDSFWQYIVKGTILVLAVWMDIASKEKANKG